MRKIVIQPGCQTSFFCDSGFDFSFKHLRPQVRLRVIVYFIMLTAYRSYFGERTAVFAHFAKTSHSDKETISWRKSQNLYFCILLCCLYYKWNYKSINSLNCLIIISKHEQTYLRHHHCHPHPHRQLFSGQSWGTTLRTLQNSAWPNP